MNKVYSYLLGQLPPCVLLLPFPFLLICLHIADNISLDMCKQIKPYSKHHVILLVRKMKYGMKTDHWGKTDWVV